MENIPYETLLPQPHNRQTDKHMEHAFILAELVALRAHAKWQDNPEAAEAATKIAEAIAIVASAWKKF